MSTTELAEALAPTLRVLRVGHPLTRGELAALTGLSRATAAAHIEHLVGTGLVVPVGEAASTGGRPAATFAFNPISRVVLAMDLGAAHMTVAVVDLALGVLAERTQAIVISDGPDIVLAAATEAATDLLTGSGRTMSEILGVGVGLPGPVDHDSGRPTSPPIMPGWDGVDVAGRLSTALGIRAPVLVDNDVNVMAVGEHDTAYPEVADLLFVKVATGVGAGIISDGRIRRGAQGAAGDLGHVAVPGGRDAQCHCGNSGCLEAEASGRAIAQQLTDAGIPARSSEDVVLLVRQGNQLAIGAVREAGRSLGRVLASCVSLLNPAVIVVGGDLAEVGEHVLAGIREVVFSRSLPLATQHLQIVTSTTGDRAAILGASTMAIENALGSAGLATLL